MIRHIQSTYKNGFEVAESLENMKVCDWDAVEPKRTLSTETNADKNKIEQEGLDMKWKEIFKLHTSRKTEFISEMRKAYALIMDKYVTETMRCKRTRRTGSSYEEVQRYRVVRDD